MEMEVEEVAWAVAAMVKAGVVELVAMETVVQWEELADTAVAVMVELVAMVVVAMEAVVTHSTRRSRCMQPRWQLHHHPDT